VTRHPPCNRERGRHYSKRVVFVHTGAMKLSHAQAVAFPGVCTVTEVAEILRCSKAHVHNLINGKVVGVPPLPSLRLGRRRIVRRESLQVWMAQNERGAA
jgi:excisionase family DNA binding protein